MVAWFKAGVNSEVESLRIFVELHPKQGLSASENGSLLENMSSRDKTPGALPFMKAAKETQCGREGSAALVKGGLEMAWDHGRGRPDQTRRRPGPDPASA